MRAFDAILFDVDGTLVDSEPVHTLAWTRLLERLGHAPADGWSDRFVGIPDSLTLPGMHAMFPGLDRQGDILAMKRRLYRELVAELGPRLAMPGIFTPLRQLAAAGVPMAVGTNGTLADCRAVLGAAGLLGFFATLATFDQVENGKPAPDVYLAAAGRLGRDPGRCAVVEDSAAGLGAGKAAGCLAVGVASARPPQDLGAADVVLPDTASALEWMIDRLASAGG